jgi:hypothetical protein
VWQSQNWVWRRPCGVFELNPQVSTHHTACTSPNSANTTPLPCDAPHQRCTHLTCLLQCISPGLRETGGCRVCWSAGQRRSAAHRVMPSESAAGLKHVEAAAPCASIPVEHRTPCTLSLRVTAFLAMFCVTALQVAGMRPAPPRFKDEVAEGEVPILQRDVISPNKAIAVRVVSHTLQ